MLPSMLDEAVPTLVRSAELLALLMLPVYVWSAGRRLLRAFDTVGYAEAPALGRFSFASGAVTGFLLAFVSRDPSYYALETVLQPLGPWAVPFDELFTVWLDPRAYSPAPLWERLRALDPQDPVAALTGLAALLAGLAAAGAVRSFPQHVARVLLMSALVWFAGAALAVYIVCASAWAVHILSFWALAVVILLVRWHGLRHGHG
ncbi:MAG TPA: hypothetical protein VD978_15185 [Azospirillum sp.]|nr:hypothetical protein [Azospirillum sp.]